MKKIKLFSKVAVMFAAIVFASSCSGDDSSGTGGNSGSYLQGKVDGSLFKAEIMGQSTVVALRTGSGANSFIQVTGSNADQKNMNVQLFGVTETGTYEVGPESGHILSFFMNNVSYDTSDCSGATGSVTVTALTDSKIEGTFTFVGKVDEDCAQGKEITQGKFRGVFISN